MHPLFEQILKPFTPYISPLVPTTILWHHVKTSNGWTSFLKEGDCVFIEAGKLCNCHDKPTHIIVSLWQTLDEKKKEIHVIELSIHKQLSKIVL